MLVLTRRLGQAIQIGEDVQVEVVRIGPADVRLGVTAPRGVPIVRDDCKTVPPPVMASEGTAQPKEVGCE